MPTGETLNGQNNSKCRADGEDDGEDGEGSNEGGDGRVVFANVWKRPKMDSQEFGKGSRQTRIFEFWTLV